jgi:hypothetical protein
MVAIDAAVDDWLVRRLDAGHRSVVLAADRVCRHGAHGARCGPCSQAADLAQLVGAAGHLDRADLAELDGEVQRWRTWAAVVTGWQSPPYAPRAPCPICSRTGEIRIRLDTRCATCLACGEAWDQGTIGLLAQYIRAWAPESASVLLDEQVCAHSWRRYDDPDGAGRQSGVCVRCRAGDARLLVLDARTGLWRLARLGEATARHWPPGTPVWTELDGAAAEMMTA